MNSNRSNLRNYALKYANRGLPVLPLHPGTKRPIGELVPKGFKNATTDPERIDEWWKVAPQANIGVVTGSIMVVDLDVKNGPDGIKAWEKLQEQYGTIETAEVTTPSGGRHLYFKVPEGEDVGCSSGDLPDGIDVRGQGGYVVVPPSSTPKGKYESRQKMDLAEAPDWLLEKIAGEGGFLRVGSICF